MKFCKNCGTKLDREDQKFCGGCGANLRNAEQKPTSKAIEQSKPPELSQSAQQLIAYYKAKEKKRVIALLSIPGSLVLILLILIMLIGPDQNTPNPQTPQLSCTVKIIDEYSQHPIDGATVYYEDLPPGSGSRDMDSKSTGWDGTVLISEIPYDSTQTTEYKLIYKITADGYLTMNLNRSIELSTKGGLLTIYMNPSEN